MLDLSKDKFVAFAFARGDVLVEIDRSGAIRFATGAVQALLGAAPEKLVGRSLRELVPEAGRGNLEALMAGVRTGRRLAPVRLDLSVGKSPFYADVAGCPLPGQDGYFISFRALPPAERSVAAEPHRDQVTGLRDAEGFAERAKGLLAAGDGKARKLTMVDIDNLDKLLATLPPAERESLQRELGDALRAQADDPDGVGRMSDTKFGLVHDAGVAPEAIKGKLAAIVKRSDPKGMVALAMNTMDLTAEGLSEADAAKALVFAVNKFAQDAQGDFTLAKLSDGLKDAFGSAVGRISEFRKTIEEKKFVLHFQPIVDLKSGQVHHQEALTRLPDGRSPFATVTFAEEAGMIQDLDFYVAERAIETLQHNEGAVDIAINVSGRSLETPLFVAHLEALLPRLGASRNRLMIEITESSMIKDLGKVAQIVQRLRKGGQRVCIDDFGSGAAAFHYLRALTVDVVKIDGMFVKELPTNQRDRTFVRAIQLLCSELGCESVAEMVEGSAHVEILKVIGVDQAQGYFFAKPAKEVTMRNNLKPGMRPPASRAASAAVH